mmetsp:Transcript_76556/g.237052  ORF Transcript_76556/g.237052 Transcript_76556/m.237052 type:complete len:127 (+) Transcript_76556:206-586(+)
MRTQTFKGGALQSTRYFRQVSCTGDTVTTDAYRDASCSIRIPINVAPNNCSWMVGVCFSMGYAGPQWQGYYARNTGVSSQDIPACCRGHVRATTTSTGRQCVPVFAIILSCIAASSLMSSGKLVAV